MGREGNPPKAERNGRGWGESPRGDPKNKVEKIWPLTDHYGLFKGQPVKPPNYFEQIIRMKGKADKSVVRFNTF